MYNFASPRTFKGEQYFFSLMMRFLRHRLAVTDAGGGAVLRQNFQILSGTTPPPPPPPVPEPFQANIKPLLYLVYKSQST